MLSDFLRQSAFHSRLYRRLISLQLIFQKIVLVRYHVENLIRIFFENVRTKLLSTDLIDSIRFHTSFHALFQFVLLCDKFILASETISHRYLSHLRQVLDFFFKLILSNCDGFCANFLVFMYQSYVIDISLSYKVKYFSLVQGVRLGYLFVLLFQLPCFLFEVAYRFLLAQFFLEP